MLDTNILVSALLVPSGAPGIIYQDWVDGAFTLLVSDAQLKELKRTLAKPKLAVRIRPHRAGRLVNTLKKVAEVVGPLPLIQRSRDPDDDFLLAMAEAGRADYLVTGDKSGLLELERHGGARIIAARDFAETLNKRS